MPTTLKRTLLTHKPPIENSLREAARQWPDERGNARALLEHVITDWKRRIDAERADPLADLVSSGVISPPRSTTLAPFVPVPAQIDLDAILAADRAAQW